MSTETTERLSAARKTEEELAPQLDDLADQWAVARMALRIPEIEEELGDAEREDETPDSIEDLKAELDALRGIPRVTEAEVRRKGKVVTDISWKNAEDVFRVYIWSNCTNCWVLLKVSNWHPGRVGGLVGTGAIVIYKYYGGNFQLMRYKGQLYWIRTGPSTVIRQGGPEGPMKASLCTPYTRLGGGGYILTSIHGDRIHIGPKGYVLTCLTGKLIRRIRPNGRIMAAIDGNLIRKDGPKGKVWAAIEGEASDLEKAALATGLMRLQGVFDQKDVEDE